MWANEEAVRREGAESAASTLFSDWLAWARRAREARHRRAEIH
jgi:hypothetical protein